MALLYDIPPNVGALRQGEILRDIWIHRPLYPPVENQENLPINVHSIYHRLMIILSADCDLEQDFNKRFPDSEAREQYQASMINDADPSLIPHILLCDIYEEPEIRPRIPGSDIWKQIRKTQNERYHCFELASVGNPPQAELPILYLDFKKSLSLPTASLYEGLRVKGIKRVALVPPIYIHDLMHRFYGFLSRVGLP